MCKKNPPSPALLEAARNVTRPACLGITVPQWAIESLAFEAAKSQPNEAGHYDRLTNAASRVVMTALGGQMKSVDIARLCRILAAEDEARESGVPRTAGAVSNRGWGGRVGRGLRLTAAGAAAIEDIEAQRRAPKGAERMEAA